MVPRFCALRPAIGLLVAVALTHPGRALAQRDCCFARAVPPTLIGVNFPGRIDDVLDRLEKAGFGDYDPGNRRIAGLGYLTDTPPMAPPPTGSDEIGGQILTPSISCFELMCGPHAPAILSPMGGHPNGARLLRVVIAVVADLDGTCRSLEGHGRGPWATPHFGDAYDDASLGARIRETRVGLGSLRLIAPTDPNGAAARWLANGGPRWIGFAVEVGDMQDAERWLHQKGVAHLVVSQGSGWVVRIDPVELDGLLVEFVSKRDRGDPPRCSSGIRF